MNKKAELKAKLDELGINENSYSLDGELLPDRMILFGSADNWSVFYCGKNEKRNDEITFQSEEEACQYIYEFFRTKRIKLKNLT